MTEATPPRLGLLLRELPWFPVIVASRFRRPKKSELGIQLEGKPSPVLVVPGLMSNDGTTSLLRRTLSRNGFPTYSSRLGLVTGVTDTRLATARQRLEEMVERHEEPAIIVGWSLGGIYGRVLAQRHPELVQMVVTLGTPFSGNRQANNAWRIYNALNDHTVDAPKLPDNPSEKPPAHTVAVWSPSDGIVAPQSAKGTSDERDAEYRLDVTHFAFGAGRRAAEQVTQIVVQELAAIRARKAP